MRNLLAAIADTWADAGHGDVAGLIRSVAVSDTVTAGTGVSQHLVVDYTDCLARLNLSARLKDELLRTGTSLVWSEGSMKMPDSFRGRFCYVELAGPDGMIRSDTFSFGLYLQARDTIYPSHWHEAVEHYLVLSGSADWQMDDTPYVRRQPGEAFVHASNQRHATTTYAEPLLALWCWQGNIANSTYRIVGVDA